MDNYIYKERRLSKTEEMFQAVFTSKAVLAFIIMSFTVLAGSIAFSALSFSASQYLTLENFDIIYEMFPDFGEDVSSAYNGLYYSTRFFGYSFLVVGGVYLWIAIGTLIVYKRSKVLNSQYSPRAGFIVLQAFGITKIVLEGFSTMLSAFFGLGLLLKAETFLAGIIVCAFIAVNFMYTVSIIVFCSSVKKTIDGVMPSSSGAGVLQFSSFITGVFTGIISAILMLYMIVLFVEAAKLEAPAQAKNVISVLTLSLTGEAVILLLMSVTHFLIFAIVRHYAKKLPIAMNAEQVYRQNMSNLYPEQQYLQNQPYQQMQNNGYVPYQQTPQNSYNGYMPYSPPNSQPAPADDLHPQADYTQYPPYDPTKKY